MKHKKNLVEAGKPLKDAKKALILLHGRGGSAEDIISLAGYLPVDDFYIVAPQATNNSWYPYGFMAPIQQNKPWLSSALELVNDCVSDIKQAGITSDKIFILGFSQGACLALEYSTRFAQRWGGVIAFTGGLIGDQLYPDQYSGNFNSTPILICTSDNDPHVPLMRSEDSKGLMEKMEARVSLHVYPGRPHTILPEELALAAKLFA